MGFREFFKLNVEKTALLVALVILAPLPFYVIIGAGFAPPILAVIFSLAVLFQGESFIFLLFGLLFFLVHLLVAYLVTKLIYWPISKIKEKGIRWGVIAIVIGILLVLSFFNIYVLGGAGGGQQAFNILEYFSWIKG